MTQDGTTITMDGAPGGTILGFSYWSSGNKGYSYEGTDVLTIAGMNATTNDTFAGISGTLATSIPDSGSATYTGSYSATYYRGGATNLAWNARGDLTTEVDFEAGTLAGSGTGNYSTSLNIAADIDGSQFNGTALFIGEDSGGIVSVPLTGGFYGTDTIAGIYQGDTVAGNIYGITP